MARKFLFLTALLALTRCAQIEPLTGGDKDTAAPQIVSQEPEQGTVNFKGNQVLLEFDEYVKLKDVRSTISSNPSNIRVQAELKDKKLRLFWEEPLYDSTTYVIQLSGAIIDNHESNDSIMQLAFSTGPTLDSLQLQGFVKDAFSSKPLEQLTVGLYPKDSLVLSHVPLYAVRTDKSGSFTFRYLKPGSYQLFAFNDANKNQKPDNDESMAFMSDDVSAGDTSTIQMRLFRTRMTQTLQVKLNLPGSAYISGIDSLDLDRLTVDGLPPNLFERFSHDSLLVELPVSETGKYRFAYDSLNLLKTVSQTERNGKLIISAVGNTVWFQGDTLYFRVYDRISDVDTNGIIIRSDAGDTLSYRKYIEGNKLMLVPEGKSGQPITVKFSPSAIRGQGSVSDSLKVRFDSPRVSDLTDLELQLKSFEGEWLVQLIKGERVVYAQRKPAEDTMLVFRKIVPGDYSVRLIFDANRNGKWDSGNYPRRRQPEILYQFTLTQKLRPNWEVEETLIRP